MIYKILILIGMIFCHIVDDFYLQGILASMKQKDWWKSNAPNSLYRYDYIVALFVHSFSWACSIMWLPVLYYLKTVNVVDELGTICAFLSNIALHALLDNLKANQKTINLVIDQLCHMLQIFITWVGFVILQ